MSRTIAVKKRCPCVFDQTASDSSSGKTTPLRRRPAVSNVVPTAARPCCIESGSASAIDTGWPTASAAVQPNMRSAPGFQ
jgi:hypothetical protein